MNSEAPENDRETAGTTASPSPIRASDLLVLAVLVRGPASPCELRAALKGKLKARAIRYSLSRLKAKACGLVVTSPDDERKNMATASGIERHEAAQKVAQAPARAPARAASVPRHAASPCRPRARGNSSLPILKNSSSSFSSEEREEEESPSEGSGTERGTSEGAREGAVDRVPPHAVPLDRLADLVAERLAGPVADRVVARLEGRLESFLIGVSLGTSLPTTASAAPPLTTTAAAASPNDARHDARTTTRTRASSPLWGPDTDTGRDVLERARAILEDEASRAEDLRLYEFDVAARAVADVLLRDAGIGNRFKSRKANLWDALSNLGHVFVDGAVANLHAVDETIANLAAKRSKGGHESDGAVVNVSSVLGETVTKLTGKKSKESRPPKATERREDQRRISEESERVAFAEREQWVRLNLASGGGR